jgi:hypothetical protein
MEHVVLPTQDEIPGVKVLAWIDDIVIAAPDETSYLAALASVVDRILKFGGRLNIDKCNFLVDRLDWCGVEIDVPSSSWRIAPGRVASLSNTPDPTDREALAHLLGILRYYFFGVHDHVAQRARIAKLTELDVPRAKIRELWTEEHAAAKRDAIKAIVDGEWAKIFDPTRPVYVATDASGNHGYAVVA